MAPDESQGDLAAQEAIRLAGEDERATRGEFLFPLPSAVDDVLKTLLVDPRDLPAATLVINVCLTSVPATAMLLFMQCHSHLSFLGLMLVNHILYFQRMALTLHVTEHRPLFTSSSLNALVPLIFLLIGTPYGMYRAHHVVMHHVVSI